MRNNKQRLNFNLFTQNNECSFNLANDKSQLIILITLKVKRVNSTVSLDGTEIGDYYRRLALVVRA